METIVKEIKYIGEQKMCKVEHTAYHCRFCTVPIAQYENIFENDSQIRIEHKKALAIIYNEYSLTAYCEICKKIIGINHQQTKTLTLYKSKVIKITLN